MKTTDKILGVEPDDKQRVLARVDEAVRKLVDSSPADLQTREVLAKAALHAFVELHLLLVKRSVPNVEQSLGPLRNVADIRAAQTKLMAGGDLKSTYRSVTAFVITLADSLDDLESERTLFEISDQTRALDYTSQVVRTFWKNWRPVAEGLLQ